MTQQTILDIDPSLVRCVLSTPTNQASRERAGSRRGSREQSDLTARRAEKSQVNCTVNDVTSRTICCNDNWYSLWIHNLWSTFASSISSESLKLLSRTSRRGLIIISAVLRWRMAKRGPVPRTSDSSEEGDRVGEHPGPRGGPTRGSVKGKSEIVGEAQKDAFPQCFFL